MPSSRRDGSPTTFSWICTWQPYTTVATPGHVFTVLEHVTQPLPPPPLLSLRGKMRASAAFPQTLLTNPVPSAVRLDQPTDVTQMLMALLSSLLLMLFIPSLLPTPNPHVQYSQLKPASGPQTRGSSFGLSSFRISTSPSWSIRVCFPGPQHPCGPMDNPPPSLRPPSSHSSGTPRGVPPKE